MHVQSPEIIRKDANLSEYRIAKMLGVSQTNYQDIVSGKIKIPSGRTIASLIMIAIRYAGYTEAKALKMVCDDFGIDPEIIEQKYNDNKKYKKSKIKNKKS
jgi:transcriptional regulator with XRE-family HTH domain